VLGKRYIGLFLDPVLACNFRCKMCYFSNEEKRKQYQGLFHYDEIERIAQSLFRRALKLQIGCGAEPTLHKDLIGIIALGKRYKIPYISLTTNGSLLTKELLSDAAKAGLNELTLSTHGLTKETYEYLMTNGRFELFRQLLAHIREVKKQYPLKLRINYTINNDNVDELSRIWEVVGDEMDILQLRPVQKIGESEYMNFDLTGIYEKYDAILAPLMLECRRRKIRCIIPEKENIMVLMTKEANDESVEQATCCYVSPRGCWQDDFDYKTETFDSYAKAHRLGRKLAGDVFMKRKAPDTNRMRRLNYVVR
jgi:molybdenum cofactor biosynthesis enzyme MoaA